MGRTLGTGWDSWETQLTSTCVHVIINHMCIRFFQDILVVYPANDVEHTTSASTISLRSLVQIDFSAALKWEKVKQANFKLNGLKRIDESVVREGEGREREREREREKENSE